MAEVKMTIEEYLGLIQAIQEGNLPGQMATDTPTPPTPKKRRGRKNPKLAKAVKEANKKLRLKNGKLKKGKTQKDVMTLAHRLLKKM